MSEMRTTLHADARIIELFAKRDKCWMCKHKFAKPVILPVEKPIKGKFQPNINNDVLVHLSETHGLPDDTVRDWVHGSVYGLELNDFGIKHVA